MSREQYIANPMTMYWYDAANRVVIVTESYRWLFVEP